MYFSQAQPIICICILLCFGYINKTNSLLVILNCIDLSLFVFFYLSSTICKDCDVIIRRIMAHLHAGMSTMSKYIRSILFSDISNRLKKNNTPLK